MRSERVDEFVATFKEFKQERDWRTAEETYWIDLLADAVRNAKASEQVETLLDRCRHEWNDRTESFCWTLPHRTARPKIRFEGRNINASRLVFVVKQCWPLAAETLVRHRCDNPRCLNPDHLQHGDALLNEMDKLM